jgi:hypothetical protein
LVIAALIAVAVLWILARIRFPDRAATPNPVQPLLTQIAPPPRFADLAAEVLGARLRLGESLFSIPVSEGREAMAIRPGLAVAWLGAAVTDPSGDGTEVLAFDPASGVALIRMPAADRVTFPPLWMPRDLDEPRYLIASDVAGNRVSVRPVFIGALVPVNAAAWPGAIWQLPAHAEVHAGSFVFMPNGELVGLVISHGTTHALVPADVLVRGTAWVEAADPVP